MVMSSKEKRFRYCKRHPERIKEQTERYKPRVKAKKVALYTEVRTHYGGGRCACVRCGESRMACLSIDHINGKGREELMGRKYSTYPFYISLKQQGYPPGYQTLCMNCQFIKRFENNEHNNRDYGHKEQR